MRIYYIFLASLLLTIGCKTPTIEAKNSYIVKSIKDFGAKGNGISNDHQPFLRAAQFFNARKGNGKLIIPNGIYKVGQQKLKNGIYKGKHLFLLRQCSNFKIESAVGAKIKYKDGVRYGTFIPFSSKAYASKAKIVRKYEYLSTVGNAFYFIKCKNIEMRGVKVFGNAENALKGGRYGDRGIQAPYSGISVLDGVDIKIDNCDITNFGLDGIYIATTANTVSRSNIVITNSSCEYNGRQGLSIVGADGVRVTNCKFNYTGKGRFSSSPMAGIDIEPNRGSKARDIYISNCEMIDNGGVGFISMNGDVRDVRMKNSLIIGKYNWSCWVQNPQFTFTNCKFYGSIAHGYRAKSNLDRTQYLNCYFSDTTFKTKGAYLAEISSGYNQLFQNCTFKAKNKKVIYHRSNTQNKNLYTTFKGCTFWVNTSKYAPKSFLGILGKVRLINNTFETSETKSQLKGKYFKFENAIGRSTNKEIFGLKSIK